MYGVGRCTGFRPFLRSGGARALLAVITTVVVLGHISGFYEIPYIRQIEDILYDTRVRISAPGGVDNRIVIVAIDAASLQEQIAKVADPELTPSARVLREMREQELPYFRLTMAYSERWASYFRDRPLAPAVQAAFETHNTTLLR